MIIIDTNILIYAYTSKVNIVKNIYEIAPNENIIVPNVVIRELEGIENKKGKYGLAARFALKYVRHMYRTKHISIIEDKDCEMNNNTIDKIILCMVVKRNGIICTNDKNMIRWAKSNKIRVISVRGDRRLGFI